MKITKARENVVEQLYANQFNNVNLFEDPLIIKFLDGINKHKDTINDLIEKRLINWRLEQLNPVDLAILQIGVYELLYEDTPTKIVVSEALRLGNLFSTTKSTKFIHSVLSEIIKENERD